MCQENVSKTFLKSLCVKPTNTSCTGILNENTFSLETLEFTMIIPLLNNTAPLTSYLRHRVCQDIYCINKTPSYWHLSVSCNLISAILLSTWGCGVSKPPLYALQTHQIYQRPSKNIVTM